MHLIISEKMKHKIVNWLMILFKIALFLFAAALTIWIILQIDFFGHEIKRFLFLTDQWDQLVMWTLALAIVIYLLKKILVWMWHIEFVKK